VVSTGSTAAEVVTVVFTAVGTIGLLGWAIYLWRGDRDKDRRAQTHRVHGYKDGRLWVVENNNDGAVYAVSASRMGRSALPLAQIIPVGGRARPRPGTTNRSAQARRSQSPSPSPTRLASSGRAVGTVASKKGTIGEPPPRRPRGAAAVAQGLSDAQRAPAQAVVAWTFAVDTEVSRAGCRRLPRRGLRCRQGRCR
jgi:hypothetical protein